MRDDTRATLELFVEKADLLEQRNFVKFITEHGVSINLSASVGGLVETTTTAPDAEAIDAAMVTFRMFIQDNDRISLRNIGKLMDDSGLSGNWKTQVADVRQTLSGLLTGPSSPALQWDGQLVPSHEIMEVFIYGSIAHTTKARRERYLSWKANPLLFQFFQHAFMSIVLDVYGCIRYIADCTRLELAGEPVPPLPSAAERAEQAARCQAEEEARMEERRAPA